MTDDDDRRASYHLGRIKKKKKKIEIVMRERHTTLNPAVKLVLREPTLREQYSM